MDIMSIINVIALTVILIVMLIGAVFYLKSMFKIWKEL